MFSIMLFIIGFWVGMYFAGMPSSDLTIPQWLEQRKMKKNIKQAIKRSEQRMAELHKTFR